MEQPQLWLSFAREGDPEQVLSAAEEYECSTLDEGELSSLFFHILTTSYLICNDAENALLALRRWALFPGVDEQDRALGSRHQVAKHCSRYAYDKAFREAAGFVLAGGSGADTARLDGMLCDYLAARYVHQRRTFYGEKDMNTLHAASLGVTLAELEERLRRVTEDERRRMNLLLVGSGSELNCVTHEMLRCVKMAGAN